MSVSVHVCDLCQNARPSLLVTYMHKCGDRNWREKLAREIGNAFDDSDAILCFVPPPVKTYKWVAFGDRRILIICQSILAFVWLRLLDITNNIYYNIFE